MNTQDLSSFTQDLATASARPSDKLTVWVLLEMLGYASVIALGLTQLNG